MSEIERLIELVIFGILQDKCSALEALQTVMLDRRDADLDSIVVACCRAAAALDEWYTADPRVKKSSNDLWRISGLLACEAAFLRQSGRTVPMVFKVIELWQKTDGPPL